MMFPSCYITMPYTLALLIGWLRTCEQAVEIYKTIKPDWKTWEVLHVFTDAINAGISAYRFTICCRKFTTSHLRKHHFCWVKILSCRERSLSFTQWKQKDLRQAWSSQFSYIFEASWKTKENSSYWDASGLLPSTDITVLPFFPWNRKVNPRNRESKEGIFMLAWNMAK